MSEFDLATTMKAIQCCHCGMTFGMPTVVYRERRRDHDWFYCPAGHRQYFPGKSDLEKMEERLAQKERIIASERRRADNNFERMERKERSRRAHKAHHTRLKNRLAELEAEEVEG